jgi:serine/threonine protein kinase
MAVLHKSESKRSNPRRSDVYSVGVVLDPLLTGEPPFHGNTQMILDHVLRRRLAEGGAEGAVGALGRTSELLAAPISPFFLDTGMRWVFNANSGDLGKLPCQKVNTHLGNPGFDSSVCSRSAADRRYQR